MKIVQINCVYARGSTGKIVKNIHTGLLAKGVEASVIHAMSQKQNVDNFVFGISNRILSCSSALFRRISGRQFSGAIIQTSRLLRRLEKLNPDIVHIHCINGNNINVYRLLKYLAQRKIRTVLTLHAEFPYTGGCGHAYDCEKWKTGCGKCPNLRRETGSLLFDRTEQTWKLQADCYQRFDDDKLLVIAVSPWLLKRAEESPMLAPFEKEYIPNGIDERIFYKRTVDRSEILKYLPNLKNEKIVFHATARFTVDENDAKGGYYIVELAKMLKNKPIRFLVASNTADFEELPENITHIGKVVSQEELANIYSFSDLTVITSKRETFSMPVAESLACGTPVVGFRAGGPESIAIEEFCGFTEYGDIEGLCNMVEKFLFSNFNREEISKQAIKKYSKENMLEKYFAYYNKINV